MVSVVYHKDGTPQCSQCNTGYEDTEQAEYCCTSCVDCGFRQHGMHERAQECCPCDCDSDECWCSEDGYCCQDYLADYGAEEDDYSIYLKVWLDNDNYDSPLFGVFDTEKKAKAARWHDRNDNVRVFDIIKISRKGGKAVFGSEWHHANTVCPECNSDDVDYTKVYYCSQCGEDDLVPGEQCSCDNIVGSKDYFEQMICGDCDAAWIEDDYSAEEDEYIRCDWCNNGIGTLEELESGSVEYLGKGPDIVCMTCVTKRGIPYDVSHAEFFEAPRKTVSVSRRKKNKKISKTISDIMHSWEKTGKIGKNRPKSRKSAQKMAIAVAYSINNRKTTKKAETFGAESNFKGKVIWDWEAQIEVNPDDWQVIPKNLLNSATIDTIERHCIGYVEDSIPELFLRTSLTEELFVYTQQYGDMLINISMEIDYDYLGLSSETFGAENGFIFSDDYINYGKRKMYGEDENEVRKMFLETVKKRYPHISDDKITISIEMFDTGKWRGEAFIDAPVSEMDYNAESVKPTITNYKLIYDDSEQMEITVDYQGMPYSGILDGGYWKSEEGNTPIMPPMDFGEMAKWRPLDGTPGLKRNRAEDFEMVENFNGEWEVVKSGGRPIRIMDKDDEKEVAQISHSRMTTKDTYRDFDKRMELANEIVDSHNENFSADEGLVATFSIDEGLDIGGIDYCEECYDTRMFKEES